MNIEKYLQAHRDASQVKADRGSATTPFDPMTCHSIDDVINNLHSAGKWHFETMFRSTEIYASPKAVPLQLPDHKGKLQTVSCHFDLLVIDDREHVILVELMSTQELDLLQKENPDRWLKDSRGHWHSPLFREQLYAKGFLHICATDEIIYESCQYVNEHPVKYLKLKKRSVKNLNDNKN